MTAQSVHKDYWDGQLYVQLKDYPALRGYLQEEIPLTACPLLDETLRTKYGITRLRKPFYRAKTEDIRNIYQLYFSNQAKVYELVQELEKHKSVVYAEQVPIMRTTLTPNDLGANTTAGQWALYKIKAPAAWDISVGSPAIKVAVVDDAVKSDHPDLSPSLWVNPGEVAGNGIDDDGNGYIDDINGYDVADDDNTVLPNTNSMSHGTHVAGIVGAATNNGVGVASIGFGIKIVAVKSSNQAQVVTDGYSGVIYAADAGADVINMSWGGSGAGQTGQNIMNYAYNAGCVLVAAAGNDNVTTIFYPAGYTNVISVASTNSSDAKSSFSNYGTWIKVAAPGSQIRSTYISSSGGNTYANLDGTSMASPMVAGLCGLMLSVNPNMTQPQLANCLYTTADPVTTNSGQMGAGRIDAQEALSCVSQTVNAPPNPLISAANTTICPGSSVQFNGSSSGGLATSYSWSFPGGTPATSTQQNPVVTYPNTGTYNVSLTTSNSFGQNTATQNNYVSVSNQGTQVIFYESFESNSPTIGNWTKTNPDNGITWELTTTAGNIAGTRSAGINLYNYQTAGQRDSYITPTLNFSQNTGIEMEFSHAYRRYENTKTDSLIIYVSKNGGSTWTRVFAGGENGQGVFATQTINTNNFVPQSATDWCFGGNVGASCFTINLGAFDGEPNVKIRFEAFNNYGNNLYIDDVEIRGICSAVQVAPAAAFSANVTTICVGQSVSYTNQSQNATTYNWTFNGGTPATSTATNPSVTYNTPGTYTVSLVASNGAQSNTATQTNYINVVALPLASISQNGGTLTASPAGMSYQWFLNGNPITGATAQTYTPTASGNYSVQVTNQQGCSKLSEAVPFTFVSLSKPLWSEAVKFAPNPVGDHFRLLIDLPQADRFGLEIVNQLGQKVWASEIGAGEAQSYRVAQLPAGLYYLVIMHQTEGSERIVFVKE